MENESICLKETPLPFYYKVSNKPKVLFFCVIILLTGTFVSLPLIHIPVIIQSRGIIRPMKENVEVYSPGSGQVSENRVREGMHVSRNDTLLILNTSWLIHELELSETRKQQLEIYLEDIKRITRGNNRIRSAKYTSEYKAHMSTLKEKESKKSQINQQLKRLYMLWEDSLISTKELEDTEFQLTFIKEDMETCNSNQLAKWINDADQYMNELRIINEKLVQLKENLSKSIITAPVTGMMLETKSLTRGSYIGSFDVIGKISPDTCFFAEVFVSPSDIGWIKPGISGRILIDAYDSNYWGSLETSCIYVSEDVRWLEDQPFFIARCGIENNTIITKNGYKAELKKGMTLTVQFIVAERTLLQLITDKMNNWFSIEKGIN